MINKVFQTHKTNEKFWSEHWVKFSNEYYKPWAYAEKMLISHKKGNNYWIHVKVSYVINVTLITNYISFIDLKRNKLEICLLLIFFLKFLLSSIKLN
jgi:hypothetical protein